MQTDGITPVFQQYLDIKNKHKDEILFFRLGDFYEMFLDDAKEVSRLLNLTLTHRGDFPMCGIPFHASKIYIARLLRLGKKIVIAEQIGDPKAKGLTDRKVTETITPGTALESEYLEGNANNYLASFCVINGRAGFSFVDVTTGEFFATSWDDKKTHEHFAKELSRASPRELLLMQSLKNNECVKQTLQENSNILVSYYPDWDFNLQTGYEKLCEQFQVVTLASFGLQKNSSEVASAAFLVDYLQKTTEAPLTHIKSIKIYEDSQYLMMDDSSRRNLEIVSNLQDGSQKFTLLECINFAKTAMGNRMIRNFLMYPLTDKAKIEARQENVNLFFENRTLMEKIRDVLSGVLDVERLSARVSMDKAHAKDLQALKQSLISYIKIKNELIAYDFSLLDEEKAVEIIDIIQTAIKDDPATSLTEGNIIRDGYSSELDHWKEVHDNFGKILEQYEAREREESGIPNLKIKYTTNTGYFIEITKGKISQVPKHFILCRTLVNADRYTTERLQSLEEELSEAAGKILEIERDLFVEVRSRLHEYVPYLMQLSSEIAYIDTTSSFAKAACIHNWSRPKITENCVLNVKAGRHPVVENYLPSGEFVPNELFISGQWTVDSGQFESSQESMDSYGDKSPRYDGGSQGSNSGYASKVDCHGTSCLAMTGTEQADAVTRHKDASSTTRDEIASFATQGSHTRNDDLTATHNDDATATRNDGECRFVSAGRPLQDSTYSRNDGANTDPYFALITGPNMAGKSTYLRQNALIVLLAQIGSFVPALDAEIGIADRIFCRVGASDNLARGESTFLVEMTETANILHSATEKSLVIMDEVGRGTSTEDGLSIAQAVAEYLLDKIKCRTLFATHYHELTRLKHPNIVFLCMDVAEENGNVIFLRKVKYGSSENSYGIHVARLAGVPEEVIERARLLLSGKWTVVSGQNLSEAEGDFSSQDSSGQWTVVSGQNLSEAEGDFSSQGGNLDYAGKVDCHDGLRPSRNDGATAVTRQKNSSFADVGTQQKDTTTTCDDGADAVTRQKDASSTTPALFSDEEIILDEILSCDTDAITPLEALTMVSRWKKTLLPDNLRG